MAIDRTAPPPIVPTPVLDQLVVEIGKLAVKYRVPALIIVGVDPQTAQPKLYTDPKVKETLRPFIAEKFQLEDVGETSWVG